MEPLPIAVIGAGAITEVNLEFAYPQSAEAAVVLAVVDRDLERAGRAAEVLGATPYASLNEALSDERIEGVDIRLPHRAHFDAALASIRSGRHVLVEKPMATTVSQAEQLVAEASAADVTLCVAENYAVLEPVLVARRLIEDGAIGIPLGVRTHRVFELGGVWIRDGWRLDANRAGGGVLMDQGTHQFNLISQLGGELTHVQAYASARHPDWIGEDTAIVNCRFANGLIGQQIYCWGTPASGNGLEAEVYGTEGQVEVHVTYATPGGGTLLRRPDLAGGQRWELESGDYFDSLGPILVDWARAARGEKEPAAPGSIGLADLRAVAASYRSIETGREEAVQAPAEELDRSLLQ